MIDQATRDPRHRTEPRPPTMKPDNSANLKLRNPQFRFKFDL
jgi:hypothetical protein